MLCVPETVRLLLDCSNEGGVNCSLFDLNWRPELLSLVDVSSSPSGVNLTADSTDSTGTQTHRELKARTAVSGEQPT